MWTIPRNCTSLGCIRQNTRSARQPLVHHLRCWCHFEAPILLRINSAINRQSLPVKVTYVTRQAVGQPGVCEWNKAVKSLFACLCHVRPNCKTCPGLVETQRYMKWSFTEACDSNARGLPMYPPPKWLPYLSSLRPSDAEDHCAKTHLL